MAIRTFSSQPRNKLKKVRSVKVANLDKRRLSMKKERNHFDGGAESSQSSSLAISGTSSPNYMKATTSSSARKGSLKVKPEKTIKRLPSLRNFKRLSSKKSMRIRARYSQFSDFELDKGEIEILGSEITVNDQDFENGVGKKQKGSLERSKSRNLIRVRSIRLSRTKQRSKSRFSNGGTELMAFETQVSEPHYMKATTSQQARKNSNKGLTRTSSLRPLRILAKIPSLRQRNSKVKKRPQNTRLSETRVHRPTCSSTLKRTQFSDDIQSHSQDRESEGFSSLRVCPYTYCSIHGHRHHTPQQPLKEFISARRKLFSNQKGEKPENQSGGKNVSSGTEIETDQSGGNFSIESNDAISEVMSFTTQNCPEYEDEDDGMDFGIEKYAKPRKKWATEGTISQDGEALNLAIYDHINCEQYEEKLAETLSESTGVEEKQGALNDGQQTQQQNNIISAISSPCEFCEIGPKSVSISETLKDPFQLGISVSEPNPQNYLTDILSDKHKYTSMWQLIHQELISNEASMIEVLGDIQKEEQEIDHQKTYSEVSNNEHVDDDIGERKKLELEQTSAIKLVQGALNAILQNDAKSNHIREDGQQDEKGVNHGQIGNENPKEQEMVGAKMFKSLSKLRKMFMTAKFIKAMEGLKRMDLNKPQYLPQELGLENERVYLRHLSTKERKCKDEWMLDYALRNVVSRLDSEKQRRVAQLIEAFERVAPEKRREKGISTNGEEKQCVESNQDRSFSDDQLVERQDAGVLLFHNGVSEKEKLKEEYRNLVNKRDHEIMQESVETQISGSTLVFSEKSSNSASVNKASSDEDTVNDNPINTLKVPPENPCQDSEVNPAGDMTSIFINKQKYTSMWSLIYQHVSSETPINENRGMEGLDEEQSGDTNGQNVNSRKPDLDQSTAIKLVKEAVSSILKSYEQPTYTDKATENTSFQLQQEVESDENSNEPERKMSKSLSKLKKAIATTRFIKAMERLTKNSPRKSQIQEKVNLRHGSVNGRKKDEEWMLDYALRQVVLKLDPVQQRKVELLVEAFETMQLEKKGTRCFSKGEAIDCNELVTCKSDLKETHLELKKEQSISNEKVDDKQDDGIELSTRDAFPQASSGGDILRKEINKSRISDSALESSEHKSKAFVAVKLGEQSGNEENGRAIEFTSTFLTGNSEVKPEGEMVSILLDKQRYTNMWHLIYQHVLSNKESTTQNQEVNDNEEEKGNNSNTFHELNDSISTQITEPKKSEVDEDNQSGASDQSEAIHLVKEAIHAILQDHERVANNSRELEENINIEREKETQIEENNTRAPLQQLAGTEEGTRQLPKSFNKLKRAIVKAKFIKAMEKLRKINPRKPRHLPLEATLEEERVYLRHLSMNARKNDEEWMLDYALRKVISDLDPDQQRKVARLVEAFETVNPEQKGFRIATRDERDLVVQYERKTDKEGIFESKQDSTSACDDDFPSMHSDKLNMLRTLEALEENMQEDRSINLSNFKMELPQKILDLEDPDMNIHHQASSKGTTIGENTLTKWEEIHDANPMHEPEPSTGITEGLLGDKQKNSSMWLLLSQHVKSVNDGEPGNMMDESLTYDDQPNKDEGSAMMIDDDIADNHVTTEITENDAINLVREAINDILDAPQGLENELTSGNKIDEAPKKSLSRGYSKLRKLIICNKFIKSMEKTRKFYPQNQPGLALNSDSEMGKARLKTTTIGERKGMDEWMLNNVLKKAIDGLTPIKQRRVALLIEAFERVNPNPEQRGEETHCTGGISLEGDTMERENTEKMQNSDPLCSTDLKIEGSTTSCNEIATLKVQQEVHKDKTAVLIKETSAQTNSLSYTSERKSTNLWSLILQRVTTDMLEKDEAPKPSIDMDALEDSEKMLEKEIVDFDSRQPSSKVKSCRDMGVQTPASFDFEEDEAIKLVEEVVKEMLLVQDQLSGTESITSSTISEQEVEIHNNEEREESSPKSTKENSPLKSYNTLSKVMMCKRFIKAMDKRRKLKAISTQEVAQQEEGIPSLRQVMTSKKSLDEGMLDNALQKVIGNLAPAKKQRVALLVQAFEAVGSKPEQPRSWRGKVSVS